MKRNASLEAMSVTRLDVIIPTYNRRDLLRSALDSLAAAEVPEGLEVAITVVDNASTDGTRAVVEAFRNEVDARTRYEFEQRQGRANALNTGILSTDGDLIGIIDDDEQVDREWYQVAFEALRGGELDFVGGPYVPNWSSEPPEWLPAEYGAVVGWVDGGPAPVPFDGNYPGILMGGNAVLRRSTLVRVGLYATWLGRTHRGLLSGEDEELYGRLLAHGAKGMYLPNLKIYHYIPRERLTKRYFRRWCFGRGVSIGLLERARRQDVPYLFGLPRWQYRSAARGLASAVGGLLTKGENRRDAFRSELAFWDFAGLFYGRHFRRRRVAA